MAFQSNYTPVVGSLVSLLGQEGIFKVVAVDAGSRSAELVFTTYDFRMSQIPWGVLTPLLSIVELEKTESGGALIAFSDGREAFYSAELLRSFVDKAEPINNAHLTNRKL